jgi:hypothetical protein
MNKPLACLFTVLPFPAVTALARVSFNQSPKESETPETPDCPHLVIL